MLPTNRQRIGIDARLYGPSACGLGRYIQETVDRLVKLAPEYDYVLFLSPQSEPDCRICQPNVERVIMTERWYTVAEQLAWPKLIRRHRLDLLHVPHFNAPLLCPCRLMVTIHDLILTKFPSRRASTLSPLVYWLKNLGYRLVIARALKKAELILTVSQFTKQDIIQQFAVPADKIVVTYNGVTVIDGSGTNNDQADRQVLLRYNIKQPYLLYVGNAYPHKNLEWLINLFKIWWPKHQEYQLVLVGGHNYFYRRLIELVNSLWPSQSSPVVFPGFVPDQELAALYRLAASYVFASRYEGFGIPPLEAMGYGCPVLSSDSSCLPEVLGPAAVYFSDNQVNSAIQALDDLLSSSLEQRQRLISSGFEQVKKYSWDTCAKQTIKAYQQVLNQ